MDQRNFSDMATLIADTACVDPRAELGGSGDEGDRHRWRPLAQLLHEVAPGLVADAEVEEHDAEVTRRHRRARLGERSGFEHLESLELEIYPAQEPDRGLIVHHEHGGTVHGLTIARTPGGEPLVDSLGHG